MNARRLNLALRFAVCFAIVLHLGGCAQKVPDVVAYTETARQSDEATNIVLVVANQLGYGDLGCYGQKLIETPNVDRLAQEGCRFTEAYAGGDSSAASMWCLMTGQYTAMAVKDGKLSFALSPDQKTLPHVMRLTEYATAFVGAWDLGGAAEGNNPGSYGFDEWSGILAPASAETAYPASIFRNGESAPVPENADGKQGLDLPQLLVKEAVSFLERHTSGEPFLLVLTYPLPGADLPLAESGVYADRDWTAAQKTYAEKVARFDRDVGALTEALEKLGLSQRTAVVLTSDRAAQHDTSEADVFHSHGGLKIVGEELYESQLRVPLIVKWPAEVSPATESAFPVAAFDFTATFADMAGAVLPAGSSNGVSLVPALLGGVQRRRGMMYWESRDGGFGQAVRIGDWKAVRPRGKMAREAVELYNLKQDPGETKNQAKEHPEIVARFIRA